MATHVNQRVQKHRNSLRAAGLRPMQIWVPDTRQAGFAAECQRQSLLVAQADAQDLEFEVFLDDAIHQVDGWQA